MSASEQMPYFIKPSINLNSTEKIDTYKAAINELNLLLVGETNHILMMSTINCILKTKFPYYYWVGFYMLHNDRLEVGPYQGTLGCLHVDLGRGVCGNVAISGKTRIVSDCEALQQGIEHIACDPNSKSEIVVPVFNNENSLIGVLDVDSTLKDSFDEIDQQFLEEIVSTHFRNSR